LKNIAVNPMFKEGTGGWTAYANGFQVVKGIASFTPTGQYGRIDNLRFTTKAGHKYYTRGKIKSNDPNVWCTVVYAATYHDASINSDPGEWSYPSAYFYTNTDSPNNGIGIGTWSTANFSLIEVAWFICIDLTERFGAGNEPTKAVCDACVALENTVINPSFEIDSYWGGSSISYATAQALFGSRSMCMFPASVTYIGENIAWQPVANHKYYGRHYLKTSGAVNLARFEINGGDSADTMIVMVAGSCNTAEWGFMSGIGSIASVNPAPPWGTYLIRDIFVDVPAQFYLDGIMVIDLTKHFGVGNEPTKEWCDANIPYFEDVMIMPMDPGLLTFHPSVSPTTVNIGQQFLMAVGVDVAPPSLTKTIAPVSGAFISGQTTDQLTKWSETFVY
jgi:hypothetical protein